jgi:hypothetical protein
MNLIKNVKIFKNDEITYKVNVELINEYPKINIKPIFFKKVWPAKQYIPKKD